MSSFRRANAEASLRLYSLPRRELQALCRQYGIPTNKTNVAMADALAACVPVDHPKPKAWAVANSLRISKTTPLKVKLDRSTGLPETSFASFTSNGKKKISPVKLAEKPTVADKGEASCLKFNTTPLRRGVKRSERPLNQTLHEKKTKATVIPAFTRAPPDRFGKSAGAASSHKPQAPTPRKRLGKVVETVTRRGGDALPPASFSGLLSTPKTSEPQIPKTISKHQPEPETECVEISSTEIEFRNAALHKELFGVRRNVTVQEDQDVSPAAMEAEYRREDVSESSVEVGFEFRDMALHRELFGSYPMINSTNLQGYYAHSPSHDLKGPETSSADAIDLVSSERGIFNSPFTSSTEVLDYSGHDIRVLSSIREEDASGDSDSKVEKLEEHIQRHQLPQGRDLGPLLDDMSCDSPVCPLSRMEDETNLAVEQAESTGISPRRSMPLTANIQNSPLVKAATPMTKIRNNIDCTLTKATSILEKLAVLRADAEKKRREGYWEPKFSAVAENASPVTVFTTALVVERDLPSAKKARLAPKAMTLGSEKGLIVCKGADIVSKGEISSAKGIHTPDGSRDVMSVVSDKENMSETQSMEDRNSRKLGDLGKEKLKGKKIEVLKDRAKNMLDHVNNEINEPETIKFGTGEVHREEMSLRKLRAQLREKIRDLEASKASDLRPWSQRGAWNTSH